MTIKLHLDNAHMGDVFEAVKATLPGADKSWLNTMRAVAMSKFIHVGIPGPKIEEWKYTNLTFLANENFTPAPENNTSPEAKTLFDKAYNKDIDGPVMVFVDGHLDMTYSSLPKETGITCDIFSENPHVFREEMSATNSSTALNNLNRALVTDGYNLDIAADITAANIIQIIHIATKAADKQSLHTRGQITLGARAKIQIIESFIGAEDTRYWSHTATTVKVGRGADLSLYQFQLQGKQAIHMTELHSHIADRATFNHMSLQLGAELSRMELINSFGGKNAQIDLRGAYLGRVKQSHDIFTRINHDQPNCQSNQVFRGVSDEGGKSAFQGKVVVARDAQKTNADQSNKNLLLSRKAEANAKPELLIYADDVKCSHGATVGELDSEQLFYLRSRGLTEQSAKDLLVEAFISEVFDHMTDSTLQARFKEQAAGWLTKGATP